MRRILADSLASDHPDVGWQPPASLPAEDVLRSAISILEKRLTPSSPDVVRSCIASLATMFEPHAKITKAQADYRARLWIAALHDLPDDLLVDATGEAMKSLKWMPKPVELLEIAREKSALRWRELKRARRLLEIVLGRVKAPPKPDAVPPMTVEERLTSSRDLNRKHGRLASSARAEQQLAALQQREPVFVDGEAEAVFRAELPAKLKSPAPLTPVPTSPGVRAAMIRARANFWQAQGKADVAAKLNAEADALCPPSEERRDIPEAHYG